MTLRLRAMLALSCALVAAPAARAAQEIPKTPPREDVVLDAADTTPTTRSGREIYRLFREGLADPQCPAGGGSTRWRAHFAGAPGRMASERDDVLPLFGYVVDKVREAHLPTEYALIPFVESGYKPGARSPGGPAGLWQFIALTARNHNVPVRAGYDGRLSPVDATQAAVRYLKTLHGMFAGDWRLAVMAYNAGEYRVLGALRRSGQNARNAKPEALVGLSPITQAYVQKLRALSCLLEQADDREEWLHALDRPVVLLDAQVLPADAHSLDDWSRAHGLEAASVRRMNPAFEGGRIVRADRALRVLAPMERANDTVIASVPTPTAESAPVALPVANAVVAATPRSHTVGRGDSLWSIAKRYGVETRELIARNKLDKGARLKPGMVLKIDAEPTTTAAAAGP
ncbi:lytic transglycosylase [Lysobacter helvus]|uniref:Lytic transglycosylase n=2 Tax=Lysobacteraceae TaxID=32033 RepID=A0ABM7Q230_9GAMM|nr:MULTISPECIES: lytic transglycosylase domain-containing protein [Lysobacter]BCT91239.1 lytic transglycosylase [Lysobacter caseinilyticus]BCT94392.1 lytic transglycosylase [Lysobacter helvus]